MKINREKLKALIEIPSVTGSEYKYSGRLKDIFAADCDEVLSDVSGNVYGIKRSAAGRRKVLIDAHWDVIGLMAGNILDDGSLKFAAAGGVDTRILPSMKVVIHGRKDIHGVIGVPPPHLTDGKEDKAYKIEDLSIDTGLTGDELRRSVETGDLISFDSEYTELLNGRIAAPGLDNKVGVYILAELAGALKPENTDIVFAATSGEEKNLNGARTAANFDDFDLILIIDVTHGKTPDSEGHITFPLSGGPVLTPGPMLSKEYNSVLKECAKKHNIPFGLEAVSDSSGTNSTVYEISSEGNLCVVVSVPLRYMHTAYEVVSLKDIEDTTKLIKTFLEEFDYD